MTPPSPLVYQDGDQRGGTAEDDFRELGFVNPARLHTALNPDFFKGTVVEDAVAELVKM